MTLEVKVTRPLSAIIDVTKTYQNKVDVSNPASASVLVSQQNANKIEVTVGSPSAVTVSETKALVTAKAPTTAAVVTLTAPGPQGPSFTGATFFNNTAIGNLNAGNQGAVLEWDGTLFQPTQLLENDLTLNGGSF